MNLAKKELKLVKKEIAIDLKRRFEGFHPTDDSDFNTNEEIFASRRGGGEMTTSYTKKAH